MTIEGEFELVRVDVVVTGIVDMSDALVVVEEVVVSKEEVDKLDVEVAVVESIMNIFVPRCEIFFMFTEVDNLHDNH